MESGAIGEEFGTAEHDADHCYDWLSRPISHNTFIQHPN